VLPGKKYTPEDVLAIGWRYRWAILIPLVIVLLVTIAASTFLPDKYRSETLILVVPQRVPEAYVRSTVTTRIEDRLQSIGQEILSRTRLERIIHEFDLYAEERRNGIMQDVIERMRNDITVDIVKGDAFQVAYVGTDPRVVMQVTDRLAAEFIDENLRDRELLAAGTNEFLEAQLENSRRRLVEQEKKLEEYRRRHAGQLPTQLEANLQVLQSTQMQIQAILESINRDRDRKLAVERALADLNLPEASSAAADPNDAADSPASGPLEEQLDVAQRSLSTLEMRLTPEHPDVIRMKRVVAELQQRVNAEALATPLSQTAARPGPPSSPAEMAKANRLRELEGERDNLVRQIAAKQAQEQRLRAIVVQYEARVEAVPTREAEMAELTRDYTTLQQLYANLLAKNEESKIAANLERRQIGEQFKLLDRARLPEKPYSPNRRLIAMIGALVGLGLGIGLVVLLAYRDTTCRTEDDVTGVLKLPLLGRLPTMMTPAEARRLRRRRVAFMATAAAACAGGAAIVAAMWKYGYLDRIL
jgi:polysaccharide chain length determinant protein (PEP-CTERM system associated)